MAKRSDRLEEKAETVHKNGAFIDHIQRFSTDEACREYLEQRQWPDGPVCYHCKGTKVYKLKGESTRPGLYKCAACRKPFTVTMGTIFEDSHIPLPKWFAAIYMMMSSKKGMSAHQLHRMLGVTYRSAWFMAHRIRWAFRIRKKRKTMKGTIEADEVYIGGKKTGRRGRGARGKTAVIGIVQRKKNVMAKPIPNATREILHGAIKEIVVNRSKVFTDNYMSYRGLRTNYDHQYVNHQNKEYVRGEVHTNTIEGFFSLIKRSILGIYHYVSPEKLALYLDEICFRYNHRKIGDPERFANAFQALDGRLTWYFKKKAPPGDLIAPASSFPQPDDVMNRFR